jgi:adenylosuccinate synthase
VNGKKTDYFPYEVDKYVKPVYVELPGWQTSMKRVKNENEFPAEFNGYLSFLEEQLGMPIEIVSLGPDREQTIERYTEEGE